MPCGWVRLVSLPKIDRLDWTCTACRTLHGICSIDFDATLSTMLSLRPAIHANCSRPYHKYEPLSSSCGGNFPRTTTQFLLVSSSTQRGCILFEAVVQARIRLLSPYLVTVVLYTVFLIIILVLDHPVLHTLPRSFLLKDLLHSFLHHVVCNACILPRRSCDSVCHHRYSPQRPRLRRAAIITFAHHNNRTRPSPPQHSDVHHPARSHPLHPQRRPQRRLPVHMETRHLLLHGRLPPHQCHLRCRNNSQKRSIQLTPSRKHLRRPIHLLGPLHLHPRPLLRLPPSYPDPAQAKSRLALLLLAGTQRASPKPTESTFAVPYTLRSIPRTTTI
jgi:hypothetical protein